MKTINTLLCPQLRLFEANYMYGRKETEVASSTTFSEELFLPCIQR